ncbi:hypothetical protein ACIODW_16115 [Streptomyces sp. NPDC087897]|uniref:hypothetical protein n=1 Tax=Streptomyces sp. NPDC087897 TaxID=3365817 RepID=UPI0037F1079B
MHGYGPTPQQPIAPRPSSATLTAVRVALVVMTVLSCGLLGWAPMLRLAIVTRRPRDWVLLAVVVVSNIGLFALLLATPDDPDDMTDAQALTLGAWILGGLTAVITYYLSAEIRHYSSLGVPPPYAAVGSTPAAYTAPPLPYQRQRPAQPQPAHADPHPPQGPHPNPYAVPTTPPTPAPAPRRIDQVRAELDELSDYLRKESGESEEGGRR